MLMKIGGDTLALDADVRRQIESEAQQFAARFPDGKIDIQVAIQEEFDPLHGHRVRCELTVRIGANRQVVVREAHKTASESIREAFAAAGRNARRLRRQHILGLIPASPSAIPRVQIANR